MSQHTSAAMAATGPRTTPEPLYGGASTGRRVTEALTIPTIGIGAGPGCDAQVLVWQDMAGLSPRTAKFVKKYADLATVLSEAATAFAEDVTSGAFPDEAHSYR